MGYEWDMENTEMKWNIGRWVGCISWDMNGISMEKKGFDGKYDGIYDINGNIIGYSWEYRILMGSEWENQLEMRIFMEIIGNNGKIVNVNGTIYGIWMGYPPVN